MDLYLQLISKELKMKTLPTFYLTDYTAENRGLNLSDEQRKHIHLTIL